MSEAMERIKSLTADEPPAMDVQAIADAAARKIVEAISAAPESESSRLQSEADPAEVVPFKLPAVLAVKREDGMVLLSAGVVSLLKASLKADLPEVYGKILRGVLED